MDSTTTPAIAGETYYSTGVQESMIILPFEFAPTTPGFHFVQGLESSPAAGAWPGVYGDAGLSYPLTALQGRIAA